MKRLLFLLIAIQCISLQGIAKFNHLNKLHEQSKLKDNCESLKRSRFFEAKDKKEIACNSLDDITNKLIHNSREVFVMFRGGPKLIPFLEKKIVEELSNHNVHQAIITIVPEAESDEDILAEEVEYLKALIIQEACKD